MSIIYSGFALTFLSANSTMCVEKCRFGPRESKKAMLFSDVGRLNCNVSYTTFASPTLGQVTPKFLKFIRFRLRFHQI